MDNFPDYNFRRPEHKLGNFRRHSDYKVPEEKNKGFKGKTLMDIGSLSNGMGKKKLCKADCRRQHSTLGVKPSLRPPFLSSISEG
ncbi:hypothetical protein Tco_0595254 [Tanacetum coccineum]